MRRAAKRAAYDSEAIAAVLDAGFVGHLGFVERGQPVVIPMLYVRVDDLLYLHGGAGSRLMAALASGVQSCLSVTHLDGIVLARSAFQHSVNYRSVVVFGTARSVEDKGERARALEAFTDRLVPGRWPDVRPPSRAELEATRVMALTIEEASAKVRSGPPVDKTPDYERKTWAGVIPVSLVPGSPEPDPKLPGEIEVPDHVTRWPAR